jgi:hypothetical protein
MPQQFRQSDGIENVHPLIAIDVGLPVPSAAIPVDAEDS